MKSVHSRTHTLPIFKELKILPIDRIHHYSIITFMFRFVKDMLPEVLKEIFERNDCVRLTRQNSKLKVQHCKTTFFQNTMRFIAVREWNSIDEVIENNCSFHTYTKRVKKYFLNSIT